MVVAQYRAKYKCGSGIYILREALTLSHNIDLYIRCAPLLLDRLSDRSATAASLNHPCWNVRCVCCCLATMLGFGLAGLERSVSNDACRDLVNGIVVAFGIRLRCWVDGASTGTIVAWLRLGGSLVLWSIISGSTRVASSSSASGSEGSTPRA